MSIHSAPEQEHNEWSSFHPIAAEDREALAHLRAMVAGNKGRMQGVAARAPFDAIMEQVTPPEGVAYEADMIGGVAGLWCKPHDVPSGPVILHIHGGWFNWGSAQAFRHLVGHIALQTGVAAFIPDYRLAPEHPFPAAPEDVRTCYSGLLKAGCTKVAVTGDSAGGNLALGFATSLASGESALQQALVGVVALSPITDLSQSGPSWEARAEADPYFIKSQASELIRAYLAGHSASDPLASPLFANLRHLPPVRVHVGHDEVLLDDSVLFVQLAAKAGVDAHLDIWEGMVHGFLGGVGRLHASSEALRKIGDFLVERLTS